VLPIDTPLRSTLSTNRRPLVNFACHDDFPKFAARLHAAISIAFGSGSSEWPAARRGDAVSERTPPSLRDAYRAFRVIPTRWLDNDIYGHMNNSVHYTLFDTSVNCWLIENGLLDVRGGDRIGLVVETGCRYFAEMGYPDVITSGLKVARLGTSSVRYEIGLFRNDEETAAAEGFFVHVYVDRATRRPAPLAVSFRQALERL
jgi:acyl-CoA thioester hydrolase